jgi:GntR family transcriptional regulator
MRDGIDPTSPVPVYHQIAAAIRGRIERGELAPGDALTPLREAAERWGVNLHTVRHAYTALAREGLVETRGTRGTRVRGGPELDPGAFVDGVLREARERFGMDAVELGAEIARRAGLGIAARPTVWVVECSAWQCESHVRELTARYDVDARAWSLEREGEPGPGTIVATYFHYNDIRRRWPGRLREVRFVTIGPDPAISRLVGEDVERVMVRERDEETARNVAADVSQVLGRPVEVRLGAEAAGADEEVGDREVLLVSPRVWASLEERVRGHPRVHEARYVFDRGELESLARELAWAPASRGRERVTGDEEWPRSKGAGHA